MNLKEKIYGVLESKKEAVQYADEVRELLPELQEFMNIVLGEQDMEDEVLIQYLIGILKDTVSGIENFDDVLLRDVLEYGWLRLISEVMGEVESDCI